MANLFFMKKTTAFIICLHTCLGVFAQQNLGIRNSNYAGIQGALLNPSSIADSKLDWDVNVFSVDEVFANNFLYAPKSSLTFLGINRIIGGSINEDLFNTRFNPSQPDKLYNVTASTEILGPSFFMKLAKKQSIGLTIAGRSYANIGNISGNLAQNAFAYFLEKNLYNTTYQDNTARVNSMGWLEYGLHYATVLYSQGGNELKGGISLNYLQGVAAAYAKNVHLTYNIADTANIAFTNTSVDYGRTDFDTYRKINNYGNLNQGHGFGTDIGVTYVHTRDGADYRIGLSLLDAGSINFNRNSATYHLQADNANFMNWHQSKFSGNTQLDQTLSAVFYEGDSARSLTGNHFKMALPTALSLQADWNVCRSFFLNTTIIQGFGHGNGNGVTRPDIYSITPRYETKWFEFSVPVSLLYYHYWQPRVGFAVRLGYLFFGGDAPGALLKLNDLQSADVYAGVHFFLTKKQTSSHS